MTREEAISVINRCRMSNVPMPQAKFAFDMAIEALKREPSDDGTLEVKVRDATKVGRVLISDDKHRGGLYYPDEDEPQGDLISRAEAIDALRYAQHRFTVADEAGGMGSVKWSENVIYFAAAERVLTELPSADRSRDEEDQLKFYYVESIDDYWIGMRIDNFYYADWHEGLGFVWSHSKHLPWGEHIVDENTLWKEHTYPSEPIEIPFTDWIVGFVKKYFADRPRGEWIPVSEKLPREGQKCLVCHKGAIGIDEFIGHDLPYKWRIYLRDYDAWMPLPEPYKGGEDE